MNKSDTPTYEEFKKAVAERLESLIEARRKYINGPSALEYIENGEGKETVQREYDSDVEEYLDGKLTYEIFLGDAAFSVAYCLYMLY